MYKNHTLQINNAVLFTNNVGFVMCCKNTEYSVLVKNTTHFSTGKANKNKPTLSIIETVSVHVRPFIQPFFSLPCEINKKQTAV